jgi:citrate lyase subunit beta/citryl-CoA lyase
VDRAHRILAALSEAAKAGKGAAQLDGRMIDAASARQAQVIVEIGEKVAARTKTA